MGRHSPNSKADYQKRRHQHKRQRKRLFKANIGSYNGDFSQDSKTSCNMDSSQDIENSYNVHSSRDLKSSSTEESSSHSPFDCSSSSDQKCNFQSCDRSSCSNFIENVVTLKKSKTSHTSKIYCDPLFIKWQELKLLSKRIHDIKTSGSF